MLLKVWSAAREVSGAMSDSLESASRRLLHDFAVLPNDQRKLHGAILCANVFSCAEESTLSSFFFSSRRRHTISLRDWSSDVCSSDLRRSSGPAARPSWPTFKSTWMKRNGRLRDSDRSGAITLEFKGHRLGKAILVSFEEIGRASCRERV